MKETNIMIPKQNCIQSVIARSVATKQSHWNFHDLEIASLRPARLASGEADGGQVAMAFSI